MVENSELKNLCPPSCDASTYPVNEEEGNEEEINIWASYENQRNEERNENQRNEEEINIWATYEIHYYYMNRQNIIWFVCIISGKN